MDDKADRVTAKLIEWLDEGNSGAGRDFMVSVGLQPGKLEDVQAMRDASRRVARMARRYQEIAAICR